MQTKWTKKELIEALKNFNDDDTININVHDMILDEDNYNFYLDPIHMGEDEKGNDRGHQLWLCPVPNVEEVEVTVEEAKEKLTHYYELDIDNCVMTNEQWVEELAKASSTTNGYSYWNDFLREYKNYNSERSS